MPLNYTYTVEHTNVPNNTDLYWALSGADLTDFVATSGTVTTDGGLTTQITLQVNENTTADGDRPFVLNVSFDATPLTSPDQTLSITLTDGPANNAPTLAVGDSTPTEGDVVTFTPGEALSSPSATYYFQVTYGTAADENFTTQPPGQGATARTAITWNGTSFSPASVSVTLADLYTLDQGETFTGQLFDAASGGSVVASATQCVIQEGPTVYSMSGSTSISEPAPGITYLNTTMNLLVTSETETQNVTNVDQVALDIQAANSANVSASSNTTGVSVTPSSVTSIGAQSPDFTVSFGNAANSVSYDVDFTDSNSTGSLQGTVTVVGNFTYNIDVTNIAQGTTVYWRVEDTGTVAINANDFFSGYTTGGAATGTNGGYLSGQTTLSTDTGSAYRGTFEVRLKDKQYRSNPDFKISVYSDAGYTTKVLDGLAAAAVGEITITSQPEPTATVSGSTSLTEPLAGVSRTADFGDIDGVDHGSLNVNSLDDYTITIFPTDGNIGIISDTNCSAGSHNNVSGEYPVSSFKNAGAWSVVVEDTVTSVSETHSGTVTVVGANTYTVTTTNIPDGTILYWEVSNDTGTTFSAGTDCIAGYNDNGTVTSFGQSNTTLRGLVEITSNSGSFVVRLNRNPASTSPTCKIRLYQDSGYSTEVLNPTYPGTITINEGGGGGHTLTPSTSNVVEGNTISFTAGGTGLTDGTYYFAILHGSTTNADFTADPPGNGATARQSLTVSGGVYTSQPSTLTMANNPLFEGTETFTGKIYDALTGGTEVGTTGTINLTDAPATYDITGSSSISEPTIGNDFVSENLNLLANPDTESFNVTNNDTIDVDIQAADDPSISASVTGGTGVTVSPSSVANFSSQSPDFVIDFSNASAGSYTVSFDDGTNTPSTITGTVTTYSGTTYSVSGTNIQNGTYYWEAEGTGGTAATGANFLDGYDDGSGVVTSIVSNKLRGRVVMTNNSGSFLLKLDNDAASGNKTFKINLYSDSGYSTLVKDGSTTTVGTITINDSNPSYSQITSSPSPANVNEGDVVTITVNTTNVPDGTAWGWDLDPASTISDNEWEYSRDNVIYFDGTSSGYGLSGDSIFTIQSNTDTLYIRAKADSFTDGATETIIVRLLQFDQNGTTTYVGGVTENKLTINVTDSSQSAAAANVVFTADGNGATISNGVATGGTYSYTGWNAQGNASPDTSVPITLRGGFAINANGHMEQYTNTSYSESFQWVADVSDMLENGGAVASNLYEVAVENNSNTLNGNAPNTTSTSTEGLTLQTGPQSGWTWTTVPSTGRLTLHAITRTANLNDDYENQKYVNVYIREISNTSNTDSITVSLQLDAQDAGGNT